MGSTSREKCVEIPVEDVISPEEVLARLEQINIYKSINPDDLPN